MHNDPSIDVPLFIPEDIQAAYQDEAAATVVHAREGRSQNGTAVAVAPRSAPRRAPRRAPQRAARQGTDRAFVVLAVLLGLAGVAACTAWWTWLANETGSAMWNNFAVGGGAALVLGAVTAVGAWLCRRDSRR